MEREWVKTAPLSRTAGVVRTHMTRGRRQRKQWRARQDSNLHQPVRRPEPIPRTTSARTDDRGGNRTHFDAALQAAALPICPYRIELVCVAGFEPAISDFQGRR